MNAPLGTLKKIGIFFAIITAAFYFRALGLNWDEGAGLHPDERFLNMTQGAIGWGIPWSLYFDTAHSPMNPLNRGTNFYVYGTLPLFVVKGLMELLSSWQIHQMHMIGRWVSVACDMVTVGAVIALAWSLQGFAAAFIAAVLCATCVGLVQQAHFGTVDSMATCFSTLAMLCLVRVSKSPHDRSLEFGWWCFWSGVFAGAAAATKAPCGLVLAWIIPAALIRSRALRPLATGAAMAALAAFFVFRVTHPYAFSGPGFWDLALSERWLGNLQEQLRLGQPSLGYPPAVQWIDRSPLFSISNMFHWGIGELPFVLIALALSMGIYLAIRSRDWRYVLVASWGGAAFVYLALVAPNRYLRYQLPAYPMFFVVAGAFCIHIYASASQRARRVVMLGVAAVLAYSMLWCFAFTRIYTRETPRIAASRWIFNNIPAALSLVTTTNNVEGVYPLSLPAAITIGPDTPARFSITVSREVYASGLQLGFIEQQMPEGATISVLIPGVTTELSSVAGASRISFPLLLRFEPGRQYPVILTLKDSPHAMVLRRPRIAHETPWDDTLPLRIDGFDPFGGMFDGETSLELFFQDDSLKLGKMVSALDQSDYFFITSQRVWGSVGRLSNIYPMTQRFYRDLLGCSDGELLSDCFARIRPDNHEGRMGFQLLRTFESYPTLGSWQIPTERADESFSVYDHPRVLIFRKTDTFSAAKLRSSLESALPGARPRVIGQ